MEVKLGLLGEARTRSMTLTEIGKELMGGLEKQSQ
jgi:hypothetical protein